MVSDGGHGSSDVFTVRHLSVGGEGVLLFTSSVVKVGPEVQFFGDLSSGVVLCVLSVKNCPKELKLDQLPLLVCLLKVGLVDLEMIILSFFLEWAGSSGNAGSSKNTEI